ncbi:MAG: TlpA disulfide reductase family protein [Candidatus Binatia bacterium]|jgi:cytochrome c biogenesis protein CcmG/thiol:disulfide interchange protein DsbE|nr:TlpA disulfide reductase family protein [Candidatus Binatia bacterium]
MHWRRLAATAVVILSILWLLAFGFSRDPRYIPSPLIGYAAPPFTLTLFDGKKLRLEDLRGKAVLLNFWSSWCIPCREEARDIEAAWQRSKDKNIIFLGIDMQDTEKDARTFLKEFDIHYPNGRDSTGSISIDYGVWGIPETFFIDPNGRITHKHVGALGRRIITVKLEEALRRKVSVEEGTGSYQSIR